MRAPWVHRIDAVPQVGRNVFFRLVCETKAGKNGLHMGTVVPASHAEQERFKGIGSEVVYQEHGCRYLGPEVSYWSYA